MKKKKMTLMDFMVHLIKEAISEASFLLKKQRIGVKALVFDSSKKKVLLVRHSYNGVDRWYLPGGSVRFGERPDESMKRELIEETGLGLSPQLIGIYSKRQKRGGVTFLFCCVVNKMNELKKGIELRDVKFILCEKLPDNLAPGVEEKMNVGLNLMKNKLNSEKSFIWGEW